MPVHQLLSLRVKSHGYPQTQLNLLNQRFSPLTSVMLSKDVRARKEAKGEDASEFWQQNV